MFHVTPDGETTSPSPPSEFETGLLVGQPADVSLLVDEASKHISPAIFGEVIPTVGKVLEAEQEGYDGVLLIGPFNCLPFRISESILKPVCQEEGLPILTYESDGYAVSPSFHRQVEVHIQQVLERHHRRHGESADGLVPVGVRRGAENGYPLGDGR